MSESKTLKLGDMEIEFSELTGRELRSITPMCPMDENGRPSEAAMNQIMAIASIRKINGDIVRPVAGGLQYENVESKLSARNVIALSIAYNAEYPMEMGEQLKNESPPAVTPRSRK